MAKCKRDTHHLLCCVFAETTINLKATLASTGNVKLRNVVWSPSWGTGSAVWTACTLDVPAAGTPAAAPNGVATNEIPVGQQLVCTGTYTFTQAIMEEGAVKRLTANVSLKVTDALVMQPLPGNAVTNVDVNVDINPRLTVEVFDTADCIKPYRAGKFCQAFQSDMLQVPADVSTGCRQLITVLAYVISISASCLLLP